MADRTKKLTKRAVDAAPPGSSRYIVWDAEIKGFGLRVETSGTKTYLVRYRPKGGGAKAPKRFVTIGRHGVFTTDQARESARTVLGAVANGVDPAHERATARSRPTISGLFDEFMRLHVTPKLKPSTARMYRSIFGNYVLPDWGGRRAEDLSKADLLKLRAKLSGNIATANRILNYLSSMFEWAGANGFALKGLNPASGIGRYTEHKRERYLTAAELDRLGVAIREAETIGIPWEIDEARPKAKHAPKADKRQTPISPQAAAALRLLLFTGARLREILNLKWAHVDFERAALFLPEFEDRAEDRLLERPGPSRSRAPPAACGSYVFPGEPRAGKTSAARKAEQPRHDLKRPWEGVRRMAGLEGVRLHDLRHTHASFGVGGGLGLPVIAKLLGHAQNRTTERYAHLDADPIRRASENIGKRIQDAMGEGREESASPSDVGVVTLSKKGNRT